MIDTNFTSAIDFANVVYENFPELNLDTLFNSTKSGKSIPEDYKGRIDTKFISDIQSKIDFSVPDSTIEKYKKDLLVEKETKDYRISILLKLHFLSMHYKTILASELLNEISKDIKLDSKSLEGVSSESLIMTKGEIVNFLKAIILEKIDRIIENIFGDTQDETIFEFGNINSSLNFSDNTDNFIHPHIMGGGNALDTAEGVLISQEGEKAAILALDSITGNSLCEETSDKFFMQVGRAIDRYLETVTAEQYLYDLCKSAYPEEPDICDNLLKGSEK